MEEERLTIRAGAPDAPRCDNCGLPQSRNPHPDAGKPSALLSVGTPFVCVPCLTANRHAWAERAMKAEGAVRKAEAMLPVVEDLGRFLERVAAEQKPLLTRLEARPKGQEAIPVISLWAAYGAGNPVERVDELNRQVDELSAALRAEREREAGRLVTLIREALYLAAGKCHEQQNDPHEWRRFEGTISADPRELWNQAVCECHDIIVSELAGLGAEELLSLIERHLGAAPGARG